MEEIAIPREGGRPALQNIEGDGILLAFCNGYATMLTLEVLPEFTSKLLGPSGFAALTQLFRRLSARYIREVKQICCPNAPPEELLAYTAQVNLRQGRPRFVLMPVKVVEGPGRLDIVFQPGRSCDILCTAAFLGLVAGVYEDAGYRVIVLSRRERIRTLRAGQADTVVYPHSVGDGALVVRVEKL